MLLHLDTDLGGDTDDACALTMLLGWPGVELAAVTTVADPGGRRAARVAHCLELAGRNDVPLAAGATASLTGLRTAHPVERDGRAVARPDLAHVVPSRWRMGPARVCGKLWST